MWKAVLMPLKVFVSIGHSVIFYAAMMQTKNQNFI